ncbi:hypothetical protein AX16_008301 [Volvariella volvacea WC 439]|nr:hypothetical protein AX16_008301 [Volvariella volvacea WC 439]
MLQVGVILLLQLCEPVTSQSILPYINQLIGELDVTGGDERKVGYYAGLIESLFFITEAMCVLHWSRLSDYIGRKPVLLTGLGGLALSMTCFGLSKTFYTLVISRCLCGLLNGNIGVMKSVLGELTNPSNRAQAFALLPVVWSVGATLGPLLGGTLSRPHERFPHYFNNPFWKQYPYFLPCIASAVFVLIAFLITLVLFKETIPKTKSHSKRTPSEASDDTLVPNSKPKDEPVPLRQLLTYPVILSVSNYMTLAFLNIAVISLLPLFFAMPLSIGGLGLDPPKIGMVMGAYGAGTGIYQALWFAKIMNALGPRNVFVSGIVMFMPVFALFPVMSKVAQHYGGVTIQVWALIAVVLVLMAWMDMAYGAYT